MKQAIIHKICFVKMKTIASVQAQIIRLVQFSKGYAISKQKQVFREGIND